MELKHKIVAGTKRCYEITQGEMMIEENILIGMVSVENSTVKSAVKL